MDYNPRDLNRRGPKGRCGRCGPQSYCQGCIDPDMQSLVFDFGSSMSKCGFSGDDAPRAVFPTVVGRLKKPSVMVGMDARDCWVGDEVYGRRNRIIRKSTIERGKVTDWDDMEKIFHHSFYNECRVCPEEHPLLITEQPWTMNSDREMIPKILFEKFNSPAISVQIHSVLSLYASGRINGVVLDSGGGVTNSVPIFEGYPIQHASIPMNLGGQDVTDHMVKLLGERGYEMTTTNERDIVRDIKEKIGYVVLDYESEIEMNNDNHCEEEYELPDGSKMTIGSQRWRATETLFKPSIYFPYDEKEGKSKKKKKKKKYLNWKPKQSISEMVHMSIQKAMTSDDKDMKKDMYSNIILSGGNTMFPGIAERVKKEITKLAPSTDIGKKKGIRVIAPPERKYSTWIGGSILSSLRTFQNNWITFDEYDDAGTTIIHRKCFGGCYGTQYIHLPSPQVELYEDSRERIEYVCEMYFEDKEYVCRCAIKILNKAKMVIPNILIGSGK